MIATKTPFLSYCATIFLIMFLGSLESKAGQLKAYEIPAQTISKEKYIDCANNYLEELKLARAVPYTDPKTGEVKGFRLLEIQKASSLNIIGLKNGDVIRHVNFMELDSVNKSLLVFLDIKSKLLETESLVVGIQRNSMHMNLNFKLVSKK